MLAGLMMMRSHKTSWELQQADRDHDAADLAHLQNRYRRRRQTSGLITILGLLIGLGDVLFSWKDDMPLFFGVYWIGVLFLTFWVMLLGIGDFVSTSTYSRSAMSRLQKKRRILEEQLEQHRQSKNNGAAH